MGRPPKNDSTAPDLFGGGTSTRRSSTSPGPIYQGVSKTLRKLIDAGTLDADLDAGTCAQLRSLAASIDRESGADPMRKQASGVSLAALHAQLASLLDRVRPLVDGTDESDAEWHALVQELRKP